MKISEQEIKDIILHEIPALLERDPGMRVQLWQMITPYFAPCSETQSRFDALLGELRHMREESDAFERKVRFYERRYDRQVSPMILISPMLDPQAITTIEQLGIKLFSDPDAVVLDSDSKDVEGE